MSTSEELAEELSRARAALDEGDLTHAAHHVACALGLSPADAAVAALMDELWERDQAGLVDRLPATELFHGMAVLRAFALQRAGQASEAAPLVLFAQAAAPALDYLAFAESWFGDEGADDWCGSASLVPALHRGHDAVPALRPRLLALARRASRARPESEELFYAACLFLRRSGAHQEARAFAEARLAERPGYWGHISLAGIHRDGGRLEEAVAQFRAALRFDAVDPSTWLDIGDLLLELDRPDEASQAYGAVLVREPQHDWAYPSELFIRTLTHPGDEADDELLAWARAHPGNERATALADRVWPYEFGLPARPESIIQSAAASLGRNDAAVRMAISSFEAPSAVRAVRAALGQAGRELALSFGDIPAPDPRDPVGPVSFTCWEFPHRGLLGRLRGDRDIEGQPGLPAPPAAHAGSIAALARGPFRPDEWWRAAGSVVEALGPGAARAAALGCMVHTPPCPRPALAWWDWVFHVQVAGALVIARLEDRVRDETLAALVRGPVDWTVTAALVALAQLAEREPAARTAAIALLAEAMELRPLSPVAYMCIIDPAIVLLRRRRDLPPELAARVRELRDELSD